MKSIIAIIFIIHITVQTHAQAPLVKMWDKRFGGDHLDWFYTFQQTNDGGYVLGGHSRSGISGDKTQPNWDTTLYDWDYWIVKIDSIGNKEWDKRFGGIYPESLFSLQQTTDDGFILGGWATSDSSGDITEHSRGEFDYWVIKIDWLGNKQWDKRFGGTDRDILNSLQQTADGGYILGGLSESGISGDKTQPNWGSSTTSDYWLVKIDSLGSRQWDKRFGGSDDDELFSLQQTADLGYILGGYTMSIISGDRTQPLWGHRDYWIVKIDSLGNKQWDKRFGTIDNNDWLLSLQQTQDGGYILGGWSAGENGDKTQPSWGAHDYWIVKIDSLGNKQWDKGFGGAYTDYFGHVCLTSDAGYLLSGHSGSHISGDKSEENLGVWQTWIVKTDSIGNKQWDKTIFTTGFNDEHGIAIESKDGCYVVASMSNGGIGGYKTQLSWGGFDYWIVKFCDSLHVPSLFFYTSISNVKCRGGIDGFASAIPSKGLAPYQFQWSRGDTTATISNLPAGNYSITVTDANNNSVSNVIIITEPQRLVITATDSSSVSCLGANDGSANVVALDGTPPYSFLWSDGQATDAPIGFPAGEHSVTVTDFNGCTATTSINIAEGTEPCTGIQDYSLNKISLHPNPTHTTITLKAPNIHEPATLKLFDAFGKQVWQQSPQGNELNEGVVIDLSEMNAGIFFLSIRTGSSARVMKVVRY